MKDTERQHFVMERYIDELIDKLAKFHTLTKQEYVTLLAHQTDEISKRLAAEAVKQRKEIYGTDIYTRGLIEFSNICRNNCLYCGIRRGNSLVQRYRLTKEEILECCDSGYALGFRTFVLQGGEDGYFTDGVMCDIVSAIHSKYPDCAITLSIGERNRTSYKGLFDAGARRYLLRHETATKQHYERLHPKEMSFEYRMKCLMDLRDIGYQVGCGFMVGSPYQTKEMLAEDLVFIQQFQPDMCGIGPFIPHKDTPFANESAGTLELTCYLLSIIRLIKPNVLLPATTALGTIHPQGREKGILAGANVVMPNLSPVKFRKKYELYDNKICTGEEAAECKDCLEQRMEAIGYKVVVNRGDIIK